MNINKSIKITESIHGKECVNLLLEGVNELYQPVASTLGPCGRTVIIENDFGSPDPTKDGVTVAKAINPLDSAKRMGSEILKQAALNTAKETGDGTTTSTIIAKAIFEKGLELMQNKSTSYTDFNKGMEIAVSQISENITKSSKKVSLNNIEQVATISANNDADLGGIIAKAFKEAGDTGLVLMELGSTHNTYVTTTKGFELEKGYKSDVFVNIKESSKIEYENALVLLSTVKIERVSQIEHQIKYSIENKLPLIIVADMEDDMLAMLAYNVSKTKQIKAAVVSPNYFGQRRRDMMNDLAVYTGATLIDEATGDNFETVSFDCLGKVDKIVIDKNKSVFFNKETQEVLDRVSILKKQMETQSNNVEKEFLRNRIAKISSAIAIIHVGANSSTEQSEKADRVDDAINASKAALEEGIVAGGGIALYEIHKAWKNKTLPKVPKEYRQGYDSVMQAISEPMKIMLYNADFEFKEKDFEENGMGINVKSRKLVNMLESNIVDPAKVTKCAVKNAVSAASTLLSTSSIILNVRKI